MIALFPFVIHTSSSPAKVQAETLNAPSCNLGPYGCCHDNVTYAKGPDWEGCPPKDNLGPVQTAPLAPSAPVQVQSQCLKDQQNAKNTGAADIFVPECEPSGLYKEVQCYSYPARGKTDCWCVNQNTGKEVPGTRVSGQVPNCRGITALNCVFNTFLFLCLKSYS